MGKRYCDYCKFEIPRDASVCGHCGKENRYRNEERVCDIHKITYPVRVYINDGSFTGLCPQCHMEIINEFEKKKTEVEPLLIKFREIKKEISEDHRKGFEEGGFWALILIGCPLLAAVIGGILWFFLDFRFLKSSIIIYIPLVLYPIIKEMILKNQISQKEAELKNIIRKLEKMGYAEDIRYHWSSGYTFSGTLASIDRGAGF